MFGLSYTFRELEVHSHGKYEICRIGISVIVLAVVVRLVQRAERMFVHGGEVHFHRVEYESETCTSLDAIVKPQISVCKRISDVVRHTFAESLDAEPVSAI